MTTEAQLVNNVAKEGEMLGKRKFYYLIDRLTVEAGYQLRGSLMEIRAIHDVKAFPTEGILEVTAKRDVEEEVMVACKIAGLGFRTRVDKRHLK